MPRNKSNAKRKKATAKKKKLTSRQKYERGRRIEAYTFGEALGGKGWP